MPSLNMRYHIKEILCFMELIHEYLPDLSNFECKKTRLVAIAQILKSLEVIKVHCNLIQTHDYLLGQTVLDKIVDNIDQINTFEDLFNTSYKQGHFMSIIDLVYKIGVISTLIDSI